MLYPLHSYIKAAPQCISGRTSYHHTRLAFHSYPHLIQAFFNRLWFDPPTGVTRSSIWTWIDRMASGLWHATDALFRLAFAAVSHLGVLNFATYHNSTAHFPRGTPSHDCSCSDCLLARGFRSVSLPARGAFHLSLSVLFLYRSLNVFSLGPWSVRIRTEFHVLRITWVSTKRFVYFTYGAFTLFGQFFQRCSVINNLCNSLKFLQKLPADPATPSTQRLQA